MIRFIFSISALFCPLRPEGGRRRRAAAWLAAMAGLILTVLPPLPASQAAKSAETAVVKVRRLNLRSRPSQASKALAVLDKGARLPVVRRLKGWLQVAYKGRTGYLRHRARYLSIVDSKKAAADLEKIRQKAESIQRRIQASQAELVTFTQKEADMIDRLDALDRDLHQARARVSETTRELETLGKQLANAQREIGATEDKIRILEDYAARRLVALYKLNWLGRINILASAESMSELFHRERALERILAHDDKVLGELDRHRTQLAALQDQQTARQKTQGALAAKLKTRIEDLARDRRRHDRMLTEIRSKKSLELAAIESLRQAAGQLDRKIRDLGRAMAREAASVTEPSRSEPARPDKKDPAADTKAGLAFTALKGLLNMPVSGKVVSFFGPYRNPEFKVMNFRSGVDIRADLGEPVMAVCEGKVLYSSWFKGYGNMMIVDHGGNYYTVYAHVEEMFKTKGARVEAGEVIATVGDTGSMAGPKLHFEIRYHGKPLDPMEWIKKG